MLQSKKTKKPVIKLPALLTWDALNIFLNLATEEECKEHLKAEKKGRARLAFLYRIHSKYNKLRGQRERTELLDSVKGDS